MGSPVPRKKERTPLHIFVGRQEDDDDGENFGDGGASKAPDPEKEEETSPYVGDRKLSGHDDRNKRWSYFWAHFVEWRAGENCQGSGMK